MASIKHSMFRDLNSPDGARRAAAQNQDHQQTSQENQDNNTSETAINQSS